MPLVSTGVPCSCAISAEPALTSAGSPAAARLKSSSARIAAAVLLASALVLASASSVRNSVALAAEMYGRGLIAATPVACAFVSGAVRVTLARDVAVPAAWSLASGALSTTFGAGAAGIGEM